MKNKEYWEEYYRTPVDHPPSDFARWAKPRVRGKTVTDFGSGDGRDTSFLGATSVDPFGPARIRSTAEQYIQVWSSLPEDTLYARWFFHAVEEWVEDAVLEWNQGQLLAEARVAGDEVDDTHWRRPIVPERFLWKLLEWGYRIHYFEVSRGFSKQGNDDPLLFRVDAQR